LSEFGAICDDLEGDGCWGRIAALTIAADAAAPLETSTRLDCTGSGMNGMETTGN